MERSRAVGVRIRRQRESQHRSQVWLAGRIDVHVNTLARWEHEGIEADHYKLPVIARALCCSVENLTEIASELHCSVGHLLRDNDGILDECRKLRQTIDELRVAHDTLHGTIITTRRLTGRIKLWSGYRNEDPD